MKKRVCIIGSFNGGPGAYVKALSKELAKTMDVYIITFGHEKQEYTDEYCRKIFMLKIGRFKSFRALWVAWKIRRKYDILHVNHVILANLAHFFIRKPLVLTVHGYNTYEAVSRGKIKENSVSFRLMLRAEKKAMERADAVIAVDEGRHNYITKKMNINSKKVFHIGNAIDSSIFLFDFDRYKVRKYYNLINKKIILYLKGLNIYNGPDVIIRAMPQILKKHPDAHLLMVGGGPMNPMKKSLMEMVRELNLVEHITFVDSIPHEKVPMYYASADVVVVPSKRVSGVEEATSLTMQEGMASGKPVVASNIGGLKEVIGSKKEKKIGILFEENNPKDLANKIIFLFDHPEVAREIGENARDYILKERTLEDNVKKVLEVYNFVFEKYR